MPIYTNDIFSDVTSKKYTHSNPYIAKMRSSVEEGTIPLLYGPFLQDKKGNWLNYLTKSPTETCQKLVLEIGCHLGKVLVQLAKDNPKTNFIGMDITFKRSVLTGKKIAQANIKNAISVLGNAQACEEIFAEAELDGIILFFPDPWNKKASQNKRQLFNEDFCRIVKKVLKPGGFLWLKTDQESYFKKIENLLHSVGFTEQDFVSGWEDRSYLSSFELLYQNRNIKTFSQIWVAPKNVP